MTSLDVCVRVSFSLGIVESFAHSDPDRLGLPEAEPARGKRSQKAAKLTAGNFLLGKHVGRRSSGLYSRPRTKLIPWTMPMMMGCQATRYLSQSSSCPYRTCVFSQLAEHKGIKEIAR